jgi:transposase
VNHRRYEALRAFYVDGLTYAQAGERAGYTRWAMVNLVREYRAGKLELFAPPRRPGPPPGIAPAKDRARGRVIELRRDGLSTYEISARLATEGTPLNRASVGEILAEEGFGRLLAHPEPEASTSPATPGRDTRLPRTARLDFETWPQRIDSGRAGLLLLVPDLVGLDLVGLVRDAGYPRHPDRARGVLAAVAADAEADPHPTGLPRRRPAAVRPRRGAAGRAGHTAEEVRAHRLLPPHRP